MSVPPTWRTEAVGRQQEGIVPSLNLYWALILYWPWFWGYDGDRSLAFMGFILQNVNQREESKKQNFRKQLLLEEERKEKQEKKKTEYYVSDVQRGEISRKRHWKFYNYSINIEVPCTC